MGFRTYHIIHALDYATRKCCRKLARGEWFTGKAFNAYFESYFLSQHLDVQDYEAFIWATSVHIDLGHQADYPRAVIHCEVNHVAYQCSCKVLPPVDLHECNCPYAADIRVMNGNALENEIFESY